MVEVPLWLAATWRAHHVATLRVPPYLRLRDRVSAGEAPGVESSDLRASSAHFYEVGATLAPLLDSPAREQVIPAVAKLLRARLVKVLDLAQNSHDEDETHFTDRLTSLERRFYAGGYDVSKEILRWKRRELTRVEATEGGKPRLAKRARVGGAGA